MHRVLVFLFSVTLLAGCEQREQTSTAAPPASSPSTPVAQAPSGEWGQARLDVCSLVTTDEVEEVQESPVTEARAMGRPDGDFFISQCIYTAEDASRSVVLSVSETNPARRAILSPRDAFHHTLSRHAKQQAQGEKDFVPPRKLEGLADDAYWMGGAVYALAKDRLLRMSVGGPFPDETKMEKSRSLAASALSRLEP